MLLWQRTSWIYSSHSHSLQVDCWFVVYGVLIIQCVFGWFPIWLEMSLLVGMELCWSRAQDCFKVDTICFICLSQDYNQSCIKKRIQRNFLWLGVKKGRQDHLINRDQVCKPKKEVKLDLRRISLRNKTLPWKWLWRCPNERNTLWHKEHLWIMVKEMEHQKFS